MNGNTRKKAPIFDTKFFTPEIRLDVNYMQSLNHPSRPYDRRLDRRVPLGRIPDRAGELRRGLPLEQREGALPVDVRHVRDHHAAQRRQCRGRQWDLQDAYRYFSEANAGYHFDVNHGLNVDAGIFVSYIGLFSYYNFDNWTYQPSFVSSNTPWFFNGLRVQWFPTQTLKIEPWLINGWQSYAKFNRHPGFGGQILWIPNDDLKLVFNTYSIGQDNCTARRTATMGRARSNVLCQPQNGGNPNAAVGSLCGAGPPVNYANVTRVHEDDSLLV